MRPVTLLLLFVVSGFAANAQFTLLPQMGVENPLTKITYNNGSYYTPLPIQLAPHLGLRADYRSKQGHGVFLGIATSRSGVDYTFSNPEAGMTNYTTTVGDMQVRFEGVYQFNRKPIYFKKQAVSNTTAPAKVSTPERKGCGGYSYRSHCCEKNRMAQKPKVDERLYVRIQPSLGMAWVPAGKGSVETEVKSGQPSYTYEAGRYNTAVVTGAGLEFGAAKKRFFTISINYFKALSDQSATLVTQTAGKDVVTSLNSKVSGWNASIGIPISLSKTKQPVQAKHTEVKRTSCQEYYRMRCRKVI
jgi:hypothetical protein